MKLGEEDLGNGKLTSLVVLQGWENLTEGPPNPFWEEFARWGDPGRAIHRENVSGKVRNIMSGHNYTTAQGCSVHGLAGIGVSQEVALER